MRLHVNEIKALLAFASKDQFAPILAGFYCAENKAWALDGPTLVLRGDIPDSTEHLTAHQCPTALAERAIKLAGAGGCLDVVGVTGKLVRIDCYDRNGSAMGSVEGKCAGVSPSIAEMFPRGNGTHTGPVGVSPKYISRLALVETAILTCISSKPSERPDTITASMMVREDMDPIVFEMSGLADKPVWRVLIAPRRI